MDGSRQIERDAAAWLARREGGAWSADDDAALAAWLAADTARRVAFLRLESAWTQSDRLRVLGAGLPLGTVPPRGQWSGVPFDLRAAAQRDAEWAAQRDAHIRRDAGRRARRRLVRVAAIAATVVVAAVAAFGWQRYERVETVAYRTAVGDLQSIALADGSNTTLSSDSDIAVALSRRERHIELRRGEAFFDVAKDAARPFAVEAGDRRIVAVGTRFAVRRDGDDVRVVVTEGTVRLESAPQGGRDQPVTLLPAGSVVIANRNGVLVKSGSIEDAEQYVDWRRGYLVFRDTPLAVAAAEFNRYNKRPIVVADPAAATLRIGGSFRWSNADVFVNLLEQAVPVQAEREAGRIVVRSR